MLTIQDVLHGLVLPVGATLEETVCSWGFGYENVPCLRILYDGIDIRLEYNDKAKDKWDSVFVGHTTFTSSQGERTFDRRGVSDSFYVDTNATIKTLQAEIDSQFKKVKESRKGLAESEEIPGLPFLTTPETKRRIIAELQAGRSYSFTPAGFGTGYTIRKGTPSRKYFEKRAEAKTESYFGVGPLAVSTFDHD